MTKPEERALSASARAPIQPVARTEGESRSERGGGPRTDERLLRALQELALEAPVKLRVAGDCMAPLAGNGALVEVSRRKYYWPGDVIAFRAASGLFVLHRLIGVRPRARTVELVTQGDACCAHDTPIRREQVIGKVSGGECAREIVEVPLSHRLRALLRFAGLVWRRLRKKLHP